MNRKYPFHLIMTRNAVEIVGNDKIIGCMIHVDLYNGSCDTIILNVTLALYTLLILTQ